MRDPPDRHTQQYRIQKKDNIRGAALVCQPGYCSPATPRPPILRGQKIDNDLSPPPRPHEPLASSSPPPLVSVKRPATPSNRTFISEHDATPSTRNFIAAHDPSPQPLALPPRLQLP